MQPYLSCCDLGQENLSLIRSDSCWIIAGDRHCTASAILFVPACFSYMLNSVFGGKSGINHEFG